MANLNSYFLKDYNRPIETVIKADDKDHIYDEVSEYVITNDISNKIANFFEAYKEKGSTNGVWISGFFGSGKSHLLKILSYVLENRIYGAESLGRLFANKVKDDSKLKADILSSIDKHPSESILFNIDQQAQITSKSDQNALLQVFYKVFFDHQGFYGFQPHIAEFEAYLDKNGKYDVFKEEFEKEFNKTWVEARKDYVDPLINDAIAVALGIIYNADSDKYEDYLDQWEDKHRASIEDFANKVSEYIASKEKGFRLNFFVDEVGQYIAENTKLMLNLQTIAESLDTKCHGNSWVFVTSQEDLESLVGDDRQIQKDDFSKIQGRFSNRIPLTSSNVDEVIERRLLEKNNEGQTLFGDLYQQEHANLRTLLTFSEIGMQFKLYRDEEDFVSKYPFIPYQFDLFQQCIKSLSRHNVFQGKHASVGERSMLGVFQEVLKSINTFKTGNLVTFDLMFHGIAGTLRTEVQNAILLANSQLEHKSKLAIRILKALFLVKYFDSFKTTARNIQILLTDDVHVNINEFGKEVEQALTLLEEETYIQRRGDIYEYLTNEEKDIEEEIKDIRIEDDDVSKYLASIFFDGILKEGKIRLLDNKQDFDYTRIVDGLILGRSHELQLSFITSEYPEYTNDSHFSAKTLSDSTLMMVKLPEEKRFMREVRVFLKTDNYVRKNNTSSNTDSYARILREKGSQNSLRNSSIRDTANELIAGAQIYINGSENTRSSSSDGKTRLIESAQDLIKVAYPKLSLLGNAQLDESQLRRIMSSNLNLSLFGGDVSVISQAEQEVLNFINRRKNQNERTTLTDLRGHFSGKPYGWRMISTFCIVAQLFKRGKVEPKQATNILDEQHFMLALDNNQHWNNTLILPQQDIDSSYLRRLKDLHKELFDDTNIATEAKEIAKYFKEKAAEFITELQRLLNEQSTFPFVKNLSPMLDKVQSLTVMDYSQLLTSIKDYEDDLLDAKEDVLDKIRNFINSEQANIYRQLSVFLRDNNGNLKYVECDKELYLLKEVQQHEKPYTGTLIRDAKQAVDQLADRITLAQDEMRAKVVAKLENYISLLKADALYENLSVDKQSAVLQPLVDKLKEAKNERFISALENMSYGIGELYNKQLNDIARFNTPVSVATKSETYNEGGTSENVAREPKEVFITLSTTLKKVKPPKAHIETSEDVEEYLGELRKVLLDQIAQQRKINLN